MGNTKGENDEVVADPYGVLGARVTVLLNRRRGSSADPCGAALEFVWGR